MNALDRPAPRGTPVSDSGHRSGRHRGRRVRAAGRMMVAMPAYVISEIEIPDESQGQRYRDLAAASIACHGGRYLVRGAQPEVPEGRGPAAQRLVVVEFPTMDRLRSW